jgi:hypothetical protein
MPWWGGDGSHLEITGSAPLSRFAHFKNIHKEFTNKDARLGHKGLHTDSTQQEFEF